MNPMTSKIALTNECKVTVVIISGQDIRLLCAKEGEGNIRILINEVFQEYVFIDFL